MIIHQEERYRAQQAAATGSTGQMNQPTKDFDKAYKNLVQQMLENGEETGGNVLVPIEDYNLAAQEENRLNLDRIQHDIEERRRRQEYREQQAKAEREAKEMEGCTFAPKLYTKKKKKVSRP